MSLVNIFSKILIWHIFRLDFQLAISVSLTRNSRSFTCTLLPDRLELVNYSSPGFYTTACFTGSHYSLGNASTNLTSFLKALKNIYTGNSIHLIVPIIITSKACCAASATRPQILLPSIPSCSVLPTSHSFFKLSQAEINQNSPLLHNKNYMNFLCCICLAQTFEF